MKSKHKSSKRFLDHSDSYTFQKFYAFNPITIQLKAGGSEGTVGRFFVLLRKEDIEENHTVKRGICPKGGVWA